MKYEAKNKEIIYRLRYTISLNGGQTLNFKLSAMYFSATDTTKKVVSYLSDRMADNMVDKVIVKYIDFTLPSVRKEPISFYSDDIVIIGVPVYAGRVPNVLLKYLNSVTGNDALAVPVVVYGNRNYDDALIELNDILESNGFYTIAAGAFIGEHSFSYTLAKNRPDEKDIAIVNEFADRIASKLVNGISREKLVVPGHRPYKPYYIPKDGDGQAVDIRKVTPKTNSNCIGCKLCADVCPMGSIDIDDVSQLKGICIKCCACIKKCPVQAKYFDDMDYIIHKKELEIDFAARRNPEIFY